MKRFVASPHEREALDQRVTKVAMSARYRIRHAPFLFVPERKLLWFWVKLAPAQPSLKAAEEVIRRHLAKDGAALKQYLPPGTE